MIYLILAAAVALVIYRLSKIPTCPSDVLNFNVFEGVKGNCTPSVIKGHPLAIITNYTDFSEDEVIEKLGNPGYLQFVDFKEGDQIGPGKVLLIVE